MIGIVDYEAGNMGSIRNALRHLRYEFILIQKPEDFTQIAKLILPGVGHFGAAVRSLREKGLWNPLSEWIKKGNPFLGICLGMQLLFEGSEEDAEERGLSLFPGFLKKFQYQKVPFIGWNRVTWHQDSPVIQGLGTSPFFYFVHSYYVPYDVRYPILGAANYETDYVAAIGWGNVIGVQFHPERSGEQGLRLLKNWVEL